MRALSAEAGHKLPYDTLTQLRAAMYKAAPVLARLGSTEAPANEAVARVAKLAGPMAPTPLASPVKDFYLTNAVARASSVMAEMSALKKATAAPKLKAAE